MSQLAQVINSNRVVNDRHQTICVETLFQSKVNSQVTKARKHTGVYISNTLFNSFIKLIWLLYTLTCRIEKWKFIIISKLVGTSEAIRSLSMFIYYINNLKFTIRYIKLDHPKYTGKSDKNSYQWLAGLMHGDNRQRSGILLE